MIKVAENEIIIHEHEINQELYKVVHGSFAIYFNYGQEDEFLVGILSKGKCFGEVGFLSGEESPYTVVANEDSALLDISKDKFQDFIVTNPQNIIDIMTSMSRTVALLQQHLSMMIDEMNEKEEKKRERTKQLMAKIQKYRTLDL